MSDIAHNTPLGDAVWTLIDPRHDTTEVFYALDGWKTVADGYKQAGDLLADAVIAALPNDSPLIFPMLYCYRHFIELSVKDLIHEAGPFSGKPLERKDFIHWLERLMNRLNTAVPPEHDDLAWLENAEEGSRAVSPRFGEHRQVFQVWCERFADADPDSFRFRYPFKKEFEMLKDLRILKTHPFPNLLKDLSVDDVASLKCGMGEFEVAARGMGSFIAALSDMELAYGGEAVQEEKDRL
ncbi:MAG TPA: hypothetical protein PK468_16510 [Candidatus Hydrogenedentes bacterium]|jgi:hypothetical protein|nr:hypothetical protein [Candidatus Hydrogenedentota bacterium]